MFIGHFGLGFGAKKAVPAVSLGVFFLVVDLANALGPPPPSARAVAWSAEAIWLLVLWGYWVDRHRAAVGAARP